MPELEASGWVVDANGTAFKNGDEVVGGIEQSKHVFGGVGTLSEYVVFQVKFHTCHSFRDRSLDVDVLVVNSQTFSFQNQLHCQWRQHLESSVME